MSAFGLLLPRSWPSLAATTFPVIPPSAVFSRLLISQVSKPSGFYAQEDLVARSTFGSPPGGVWDRLGNQWFLVDIDGTKQTARQRALPQANELPAPHRRFDRVCAKGYFGRKRGQVGRTRTTVLQPYTHQWLGTFSGPGNGDYRAELRQALQAITVYAAALALPLSQVVVRIDGLYGNTAPVNEILSWKLGVIGRSKQYVWLDLRRPSKPDSNQPLMPRLPILKAEPFAISPIVLPFHSPQQGLLSVWYMTYEVSR